jgi:polyisoprenoid-binding protein YceI
MAWGIDPAHTLIEFSAKHMMVTTVKGHFTKFSGDIEIDEQHPDASRVDITIEAASLDTGMAPRDQHLRSADFLDVEHFPTITYKSKRVEVKGENHATVVGDLTIRGVTREVPLDVSLEGQQKGMDGKRRAGFSINAKLSRKDFGLEWNVALESGGWLVSDAVKVNVEAEVVETLTTAANATA